MNGPDSYPGMAEQLAQRNERFRAAAQHALDTSNGGRKLPPDARRWALHWAALKPLARPVISGEPAQEQAR